MLNKRIKCIVVDDEQWAQQLISDYIEKCPELELIASSSDPLVALEQVYNETIDVVFLDINMPELSGIDFIKLVKKKCKIVLVTAYPEYALEGYDLDVIDYLLKPVTLDRFMLTVEKIAERALGYQHVVPVSANDSLLGQSIFIRSDHKLHRIDLADIIYLEALRDYVAIHTISGKHLSAQPLHSFEGSLPSSQFVRIHKSYIAAISRINSLHKKILVVHGVELPIGEVYRDKLIAALKIF